jgi:hypothetical protein
LVVDVKVIVWDPYSQAIIDETSKEVEMRECWGVWSDVVLFKN